MLCRLYLSLFSLFCLSENGGRKVPGCIGAIILSETLLADNLALSTIVSLWATGVMGSEASALFVLALLSLLVLVVRVAYPPGIDCRPVQYRVRYYR